MHIFQLLVTNLIHFGLNNDKLNLSEKDSKFNFHQQLNLKSITIN